MLAKFFSLNGWYVKLLRPIYPLSKYGPIFFLQFLDFVFEKNPSIPQLDGIDK